MVYDGEQIAVGAFHVKCVRGYQRMEGEHEERAQDVYLQMII